MEMNHKVSKSGRNQKAVLEILCVFVALWLISRDDENEIH
jgi:hypothetical protein